MKLNKAEFLLVNNPARAFVQDLIEIRRLKKISHIQPGQKILEIGCGNGTGTQLIRKYFSPNEIHAIDLDERMINIAKERHGESGIIFQIANVTKLPYEDNSFDAIIDFAILHHVPNWKDALQELKRVLKPGGEILLEELSTETFETLPGKVLKRILAHPYHQMFNKDGFIKELELLGFKINTSESFYPLRIMKYFILSCTGEKK